MAVYTGTAANNSYTGTGAADTLAGRAGNDTLYGGLGNDRILGEDGNDSLFGGNGADVILAGNGNDSLDGGNGNDSLDGGNGNDTLTAGAGNDRLAAGDGNDRLVAADGDDVADGGNGADSVDGGAGADTLTAGQGDDRLAGGSGNDSLGGGNGADSMLGDADDDRIDGGGGNDSLIGGDGHDSLIGSTGLDRLEGGNGNDVLSGGNDADVLFGGAGDDTADGGAGDDTFAAGAGNDTFAGGAGTDTVVFAGNISSYQIVSSGSSVRFIDIATLDGDDGTDLVSDAETIVFANRTVTFASLLNAAPDAQDDVIAAAEDGPAVTGSLFGNDSDPNGDTLTVSAVNGLPGGVGSTIVLASGARLFVSANGSYRFNPNGGYESLGDGQQATYRFTYTVTDGRGGSDRAAATVTITGANDAPVAGDDTADTDAAASVAGNVLANDEDVDSGATLTVTAVNGSDTAVGSEITLASGARLTLAADGNYTYDPAGAFAGLDSGETATDSFSYTVGDGHGGSDTATVTVTITGVDGTPDAFADGVTADEDLGASGNDLLANDTDPDGDGLSIVAVNGATGAVGTPIALASGALLTVNADGSYSYDTNGAFESLGDGETAADSFTYTVADGNGDTDVATVEVTITGSNDAPDAVTDSIEADEDIGATGNDLLGNDTDADSDSLTVTAVNGSTTAVGSPIELTSGALLTVNADGSYTYDTNGAFEGLGVGESDTDSFTYTVGDGNGGSDDATVEVTITGANDAPDAIDDGTEVSAGSTGSDILGSVAPALLNLLANDEDPDGDELTVTAINGSDAAVGSRIELPSGAILQVNADGSYSYDPNGAFDGLGTGQTETDSFTYTVSDGNGASDTATVEVTITGSNGAPDAVDDPLEIAEDGSASGSLTSNDTDPDDDELTVTAVNGSDGVVGDAIELASGALLQLNAGGSFAYTPNGAFEWLADGESGTDSFTYTISDGQGGTDTATVEVEIAGVNDSPDAVNHEYEIDEDAVVDLGSLLVGASDPDRSDVLVVIGIDDIPVEIGVPIDLLKVGQVGASVTIDENYHLIYNPNGAWSYLAEGQVGSETVTYTIDDQHAGYDTATFTVIVTGTNDAPEAEDDSIVVDEDAVTDGSDLFANDLDPDDLDEISIVAVNGDDEAVGVALETTLGAFVTVRADGSYSYDPNGQFNGLSRFQELIDSFTYTVSDNHGVTDTASVEVIIKGNNEPCDAVDDEIEVHENDGVEESLIANDSDEDLGDTLYVVAVNGSAGNVATSVTLASGASIYVDIYGTLTVTPNGAYDYLAEGETAEESFTYTISDDGDSFDTATVTLGIVGVNDDPTADGVHLDIDEADGTYSGNLLDYAADADLNDTLFISAINGSSEFEGTGFQIETGAWLTVNANGAFTLEPPNAANEGETLEGSFDYTVSDGNGGFASATISFTVYGAGVEV